jgi:hypothetical protein
MVEAENGDAEDEQGQAGQDRKEDADQTDEYEDKGAGGSEEPGARAHDTPPA